MVDSMNFLHRLELWSGFATWPKVGRGTGNMVLAVEVESNSPIPPLLKVKQAIVF